MKQPKKHLTTAPIPELIKSLSIPASIGFFFNTMYNVVDTYFGGQLSVEALAALSLSFPVFFLIIALGSGFSQGVTAIIGNALGADQDADAELYSAQALSFAAFLSVVLTAIGLLAAPHLFRLLGAEDRYLDLCLAYMNTIFWGGFTFIFIFIMNGILNAVGDTKTFRNFLIGGFCLNLILDPWFMYGGLGLPAFGLRGVALATIVIELLGCLYLGYRVTQTGLVSWRCIKLMRPQWKSYREILGQGIPASANMMTVGIGIFIITFFISHFGKEAVAAYGIATRVEQIVLLPTIGLNVATLALVSQNSGANLYQRVQETLFTAMRYGVFLMLIGNVLVFTLAEPMMGIFTDDAAVIEIGTTYLRIAAFALYAYVFLFVNVSALQGVKKPMFAIWIGLFRQIIGPAVIFYLLAHVLGWGLLGIWWGIFLITWAAAVITILYARHILQRLFDQTEAATSVMTNPGQSS